MDRTERFCDGCGVALGCYTDEEMEREYVYLERLHDGSSGYVCDSCLDDDGFIEGGLALTRRDT